MRTLPGSINPPHHPFAQPTPAPDVVVDEVVALMAAAQAGVIAAWREQALSIENIHVLFTLRTQGPLTMSGLAHVRGVTLPNATCIVDRMEERGLVERVRDGGDRRVVTVRLAQAGEELLRAAEKVKRDILVRVVEAMDAAQRADFARAIRTFHETYNRLEAAGSFGDLIGPEQRAG